MKSKSFTGNETEMESRFFFFFFFFFGASHDRLAGVLLTMLDAGTKIRWL